MTVSLMNPDGLVPAPLYHHVAIASGARQIHLAGQVAWNERGELIGSGDLAAQVTQVLRNVGKGLDAAGATFSDVVRFTWYVVGWRPDLIDAFSTGIAQAGREFDLSLAPASLIGVEILFDEGILVEAEVTAVVN